MAKRNYPDDTKAAVVAALLAGQSVASVAAEYDLPRGTVSSWKKRTAATVLHDVATDATQKERGASVGDLLLTYLETSLRGLIAQAEHFADKGWLAKQDAADIAVLHGVQTDKAIRLIEALNRASEPGD